MNIFQAAPTSSELPTVLDKMVKTSRKRSYLVQLADHLIVEFALSLDDEEVFRDVVWPAIVNAYEWAEAEPSLESLWVLLQIHSKFPSVMTKQFVVETFKRKKFIDEQLALSISQLVMVRIACISAQKYPIKSMYPILQNGTTPIHILHEGPVLKGIVRSLSSSSTNLVLTLWTKHIASNMQKTSSYKTSAAFVILDHILANLTDKKKAPLFLQVHISFRDEYCALNTLLSR